MSVGIINSILISILFVSHIVINMYSAYNKDDKGGDCMAYTKATMKAVDKYVKNNYDSFLVRVPKGRKEEIESFAKERGESVNGLMNMLLRDAMQKTEEEWKRCVEE